MKLNFEVTRPRWFTSTYDSSLISLKNENSDEKMIRVLADQYFFGIDKYPDIKKAYPLLADCVGVNPNNIIMGLGSSQILRDLFMVLDYDTIQIYEDSWGLASVINHTFHKTIFVNEFTFDGTFHSKSKPEDVGGDVLYLINPHCPTGFSFDTDAILEFAKKFKYVIVDEAYTNPLTFDKRLLQPNIIIVKTFSKLGGVPGLRLGYCIASLEIINRLYVVKPMYELASNAVQYLNFITHNREVIDEHCQEMRKCFDLLHEINGGFGIECANFATFEERNKLKGKAYEIDGSQFVRVTLTNAANHRLLVK